MKGYRPLWILTPNTRCVNRVKLISEIPLSIPRGVTLLPVQLTPGAHTSIDCLQKVERTTRRFNTLKVPRKLEASLPFASKTKSVPKQRKQTYLQSRAVILDPNEKQAVALLQQMQSLRKDKVARRREKQDERKEWHRKEVRERDEGRERKLKDEKKKKMRAEGIKRKFAEESGGGRGGGGKKRKAE